LDSPAGTILDVFVHNKVWDQLFAVRTPALAEQNKDKKIYKQTSVVDLDPDPGRQKNDPKICKTVSKFHFSKCWIFSFEG
jgi:hypothetical protein